MNRIEGKVYLEAIIARETDFKIGVDYYLEFVKNKMKVIIPPEEKFRREDFVFISFPFTKENLILNEKRSKIINSLKKWGIYNFNNGIVTLILIPSKKIKTPRVSGVEILPEDVISKRIELLRKIGELINEGGTFKRKGIKVAKDYLSRNM